MSILVNRNTRLLVQGITGQSGAFHARGCMEYGTNVVAGVTPGKGKQSFDGKVPIYDTVSEARKQTGCNATMIFVPAPFAADAILEAADAGVELIVCITEGIPVMDMMRVKEVLKGSKSRLIGPNCPGIITPGECKIGIMPGYIHKRGNVKMFAEDPETKALILIGEIGGTGEEEAAAWIKTNFKKPVCAFVAGATAPPGRRMGHAGAIVAGSSGTAAAKIEALKAAGIAVAETPAAIAETLIKVFKS